MDKIKNIEELIESTSRNDKFKNRLIREMSERSVSDMLFALRHKHGLTQKEIAAKMGCSQAKISVLESSKNKNIDIGDLIDFSKALDLQLNINFSNSGQVKLVDKVKFHALQIRECLDKISALASKDDDVKEGIKKFYQEAFVNLMHILTSSYSKLKVSKKEDKPSFVLTSIDTEEVIEKRPGGKENLKSAAAK